MMIRSGISFSGRIVRIRMKRIFIFLAITLFLSQGIASAQDTLIVNTTSLGEDIIGFDGPTPVEISVVGGKISGIKVLPNTETPRFLQLVLDSGLFSRLIGKTLKEAEDVKLDAVTGATYSSEALIKNVELGIKEARRRTSPTGR